MSGAGLGLALVWLLSAAPLFLPQAAGSSPVALASLPWLVWASLPRGTREHPLLEQLAPWLAAPLLVLALALARARGAEWASALVCAGGCALLAALYFAAARRAPRQLYAWTWFTLVVGVPLLARVLESAGAPLFGRAPRALEFVVHVSPLDWWLGRLHAHDLVLPWMALALGSVLWLAGSVPKERA